MKRRFFSFLLAAVLLLSLIPAIPAEASGSTDWENLTAFEQNGVYYISSAADLRAMRDLINSTGTVYSCTFYLTADIELNDPDWFTYNSNGLINGINSGCSELVENWVPIGYTSDFYLYHNVFRGVFDGQGHTISGLYSYDATDGSYDAKGGLFGYVFGTVKNLTVENAYVKSRNDVAGGIATYMTNFSTASIANCHFEGYVEGSTSGGIVGQMQVGTIDGCTTNASVVGYDAGGIAGRFYNSNAVIQNCFTAGKVTAMLRNCSIGGIAGFCGATASVKNCGSIAALDGYQYGYGNVGGICGIMGASGGNSTVENCWFAGSIGSNCGYAAGIAVIEETYAPYASVLTSYCAYNSANFIYQLNTALQTNLNKSDLLCGKFSTYDTAGRSALTVTTTDYSGSIGYWTSENEVSTYHRCGDSAYVLTEKTDIVTALNNWVAANNNADGTLYRMWTSGPDQLPRPMKDDWAASAEVVLIESGNIVSISSAEELAQLARNVNSGLSYSGKTIRLTQNIDLGGKYWTPIGTTSSPFDGSFDGCGFTISGLRVRGSGSYHGLFGAANGTLSNIHVERSTVQGGTYCGGIVGSSTGVVDRCSFDGAVYGTTNVGGIAGNAASILNSRNRGIVYGNSNVGAVAGSSSGGVGNCFNSGWVNPTSASAVSFNVFPLSEGIDLDAYQGSIVGSGSADNCYDAQAVTDPSVAQQLLAALSATAQTNVNYVDWTASNIANGALPYYAAFSGGSGTSADPYLISSVEELAYLASITNAGNSQEGVSYRLEADIIINEGTFDASGQWLDGNGKVRTGTPVVWTAITGFAGTFDGNGHLISGLYCPDGSLFSDMSGTVSNLMLVNGYLTGSGAICGTGTVINCASTCLGSGAVLSGTNCWDMYDSFIPTAAALNNLGGAYNRWYESPSSPYPSFLPSYIAIEYQLLDGTLNDAPDRCIYGEPLPTVGAPSKAGYDFAGWFVYADNSSSPLLVCWKGGESMTVTAASVIELSACWAESGRTLEDYCTVENGVYKLTSDVTLAETAVFSGDITLDLGGHSITGYSDTALIYADGGSITVINSGSSDANLLTNAAVFGGQAAQILLPGTQAAGSSSVTLPAGAAQQYTLAVYSMDGSGPWMGFLAFYDNNGQMKAIESLVCSNGTAVVSLTAQEVAQWHRIRGFIFPQTLMN